MRSNHEIEQALFWWCRGELCERGSSPRLHERPNWRPQAERLCQGFGHPASDITFPLAVFAQPFDPTTIAVVQVGAMIPGQLGFRFLLVPRWLYTRCIRDPFAVSDRFPPEWNAVGLLSPLDWHEGPLAPRRIDQLQHILQTGNSPLLLGAVQALVDGSRVVFQDRQPNETLIRHLWNLLPESSRAELWPATFAFSNSMRFDVLVMPNLATGELDRYLTEDVVIDYPEGRYEFSLQYAIEHGDQSEVDRLFGRRSTKQFLRFLVVVFVLATIAYLGIEYIFAP